MYINSRVKREIKSYYITKKLQGQEFSMPEIDQIFPMFIPWHQRFFKHTGKFKNHEMIYIVRKCYLVDRSHVLDFCGYGPGDLWRAAERHITGTTLYVYHDDDASIPFSQHPKWGRSIPDWLPEDIEERHIGKKIKNRQQVIIFLKMMKQNAGRKPIQLKLFE